MICLLVLHLIAPSSICHICHAPVEACPVKVWRVSAWGHAWVSNQLLAGRSRAAGRAVVDAAERLGARTCLASALARQASVRSVGGRQAPPAPPLLGSSPQPLSPCYVEDCRSHKFLLLYPLSVWRKLCLEPSLDCCDQQPCPVKWPEEDKLT